MYTLYNHTLLAPSAHYMWTYNYGDDGGSGGRGWSCHHHVGGINIYIYICITTLPGSRGIQRAVAHWFIFFNNNNNNIYIYNTIYKDNICCAYAHPIGAQFLILILFVVLLYSHIYKYIFLYIYIYITILKRQFAYYRTQQLQSLLTNKPTIYI